MIGSSLREPISLDLHSGLRDLINELPLTGKYRPLNSSSRTAKEQSPAPPTPSNVFAVARRAISPASPACGAILRYPKFVTTPSNSAIFGHF
jgi:hypothetical protein